MEDDKVFTVMGLARFPLLFLRVVATAEFINRDARLDDESKYGNRAPCSRK